MEKNKAKREKFLAGLDEKLAKGKISKAMYDEKLWQFDNVVESQIDNEIAKSVDEDWLKKQDKELFTIEGDIIVNSTGEGTVGRAVYITNKYAGFLYDSHMLLLRLNPEIVNSRYVQLFLNSNRGQKLLLEKLGAQATKQVELGVGNLENIKIPLPPLPTQRQIVEKLDRQMQALEGVRLLKTEAEKRIEEILNQVWGE